MIMFQQFLMHCRPIKFCWDTTLLVTDLTFDVTFHCFVLQVACAQQAERTTGSDVTDEEPHPYTISFFLFPHHETVELSGGKGKVTNVTQHDKSNDLTKGNYPWALT